MPHHPPVRIPGWEPGGGDGGAHLTVEELCALFTREPFNLRFAEIARLNDYQVYHCLLRPRDDEGRLIRPRPTGETGTIWKSAPGGTWKEMYAEIWRLRGADDAEIARRWENYLEQEPGLRRQLATEDVNDG